ncbi:MAG: putative O-glycosylation ligase, exosortase A system-associated [Candidatus Acidiferrales bacterium]
MLRAIFLYGLVILAVITALFRPFGGLLFYLWFSFGRPGDFLWPQFIIDYEVWIAGATLLSYFLMEMGKSPIRVTGMKLLLLLWFWFALTSLTAQIPLIAFPKLWEYSRIFIMAFLTAALANSEERIRSILYVLALSLGFLGAKGAYDAITTGFANSMKGPGGMMSEQNEYALALNMGIPILVWLAKDNPKSWIRWSLRGMAAGCAVVVVGTRSRSGLLGLIMAGMVLAAFSKRKALLGIGVVIGVVLLLLFGPQGALNRYKTIPTAAQTDASAIGRLQAWKAAIKMTEKHPIRGVGLRNFVYVFPQYSNDPPRVTHNAIFDLLSETGIPGCAIFLSMLVAAIGEMFILRLKAQAQPETQHLAIYCQIVFGVLVVYMVPNMFINRQDFDLMYQMIAVEAGLAILVRQKLAEKKAEAQAVIEVEMPLWLRAQRQV